MYPYAAYLFVILIAFRYLIYLPLKAEKKFAVEIDGDELTVAGPANTYLKLDLRRIEKVFLQKSDRPGDLDHDILILQAPNEEVSAPINAVGIDHLIARLERLPGFNKEFLIRGSASSPPFRKSQIWPPKKH